MVKVIKHACIKRSRCPGHYVRYAPALKTRKTPGAGQPGSRWPRAPAFLGLGLPSLLKPQRRGKSVAEGPGRLAARPKAPGCRHQRADRTFKLKAGCWVQPC